MSVCVRCHAIRTKSLALEEEMFDDWTAAGDRAKEPPERELAISLLARESGVGPAQMNDRTVGE